MPHVSCLFELVPAPLLSLLTRMYHTPSHACNCRLLEELSTPGSQGCCFFLLVLFRKFCMSLHLHNYCCLKLFRCLLPDSFESLFCSRAASVPVLKSRASVEKSEKVNATSVFMKLSRELYRILESPLHVAHVRDSITRQLLGCWMSALPTGMVLLVWSV